MLYIPEYRRGYDPVPSGMMHRIIKEFIAKCRRIHCHGSFSVIECFRDSAV